MNEKFDSKAKEEVSINVKYAGYIEKTEKEVEKMLNLESKIIPNNIDILLIKTLSISGLFKKA